MLVPIGVVIVKVLVLGSSMMVLVEPGGIPVEKNYEMVTSWFEVKGLQGKSDNIV